MGRAARTEDRVTRSEAAAYALERTLLWVEQMQEHHAETVDDVMLAVAWADLWKALKDG